METIEFATAPVGIKLDPGGSNKAPGHEHRLYSGPAYCDAVNRASRGEKLLINKGSIKKCRWAPVVLGMKEPDNSFERDLAPRFEAVQSVYVFPLDSGQEENFQPDLVIVRDSPALIGKLFEQLKGNRLEGPFAGRFDMSALAVIEKKKPGTRANTVKAFNLLVYRLKEYSWFKKSAEAALNSPAACYLFDKLIALLLADMSVCRNSTVIPALEGRANCSYFCSGAIFWGGNEPAHMTAGIPYGLFCSLE